MEDDFGAENLEDGELWLPSDFFSTDETNTEVSTNFNYSASPNSKPYCMYQFPNSSSPVLNRHYTYSEPVPAFQFKPAVRAGYSGDVAHDSLGLPVHRYQRLNPVQNFMGERERAWSLQKQLEENRFAMNRVLPGLGMGGYRGTGVFLPRVSSDTVPTGSNQKYHYFRKGQGKVDKKHEIPPRKILLRRRQEEECPDYITA